MDPAMASAGCAREVIGDALEFSCCVPSTTATATTKARLSSDFERPVA